jgi:hypothetical protein
MKFGKAVARASAPSDVNNARAIPSIVVVVVSAHHIARESIIIATAAWRIVVGADDRWFR